MSQISPTPSKSIQSRDSFPLSAQSSVYPAPSAGPLVLVLATSLLIATTMTPITAYAEHLSNAATEMDDKLDSEDEDLDTADDGSSALPDFYKLYDLEDVKPISAEEEEALLGNWGDSDAEDGD